jgi:hypothetical protein
MPVGRPFLFAVMLLVCARARADDTVGEARQHFQAAEAAERRGEYETALREYQAAYEAKPHPAVLFNLATVYERLGELEQAAELYERYLTERPDASDSPSVRTRASSLRSRPSRVSVESQPPGARVALDGVQRCTAPCDFAVSAGEHEVSAELAGREVQRKRVAAGFGKSLPLVFSLAPRSGRLVVDSLPAGAEVTVDGERAGSTPIELEVAPGRHQVVWRLAGHRPRGRSVDVRGGEALDLREQLVTLGGAPIAAASPGRLLPPPAGAAWRVTPPAPISSAPSRGAYWIFGALGGPNALRADRSWGGGPLLGIQSAGQGLDLEMALLLPTPTFQFDLRIYLVTSGWFRPFLLGGMGLVADKTDSDTMSGSSSSSSSATATPFYTLNAGGGVSFDLGPVAIYFEGLVNYIVSDQVPDHTTVPILGGLYIRQ